jgi:hypothetical protein
MIQEDHFTISVDISINCDTQFQAIDFKHMFESVMPLNKYLQIYRFVSYFEISSEFLNPYLFDPSKDKIDNLFFKHNSLTDELNYYFSVGYEPLIRLTNAAVNIGEVSTSTFALNLSFELLMQLPSKILFNYQSEQQRLAKFDDIKFLKFDNVKVTSLPVEITDAPITMLGVVIPVKVIVSEVSKPISFVVDLSDTDEV